MKVNLTKEELGLLLFVTQEKMDDLITSLVHFEGLYNKTKTAPHWRYYKELENRYNGFQEIHDKLATEYQKL